MNLRINRRRYLEEYRIAEMTEKRMKGQGAAEAIIGDIEARQEIEAKMARTDDGGIGHGQARPWNTETKRLDIVRGRQEGTGRDLHIQIKYERSYIDLTERKWSPNLRNETERSLPRMQKRRTRTVIIQIP
jgi:hypothetical protein